MRRILKYSIRFGDEEELTLTHGMSMQGGQVVCDWYDIIQGDFRRIRFLPGELAELHAAIDEMLRMAEQHRDALTDRATPEASPLTVDEVDLVSADDVKLLRMLSEGVTLELGHSALARFSKRGWIAYKDAHGIQRPAKWEYGITDKGRRALAAQTPEGEREPNEAEADPSTGNAMDLLRWLGSEHRVASYHEAFEELFDDGLLTHRVGNDYVISPKGRRVLAEREGDDAKAT